MLVVLALIALLNTFDQAILGVTTPALQTEFRLTDTQVGLLSGAFVLVYGLAALPGLLLAMLALTMREPLRGSAEARGPLTLQPQAASRRAFIGLLRIRTLVAAVLSNTFVVFAQTGVGGFVALYTTRQFGVDLAQVGAMVGGPLLIGSLVATASEDGS